MCWLEPRSGGSDRKRFAADIHEAGPWRFDERRLKSPPALFGRVDSVARRLGGVCQRTVENHV